MSDLSVKVFNMINPIVIASSPATQGIKAVLKSARAMPGAIAMRNFGHGAGGGSYNGKDHKPGHIQTQIHAFGTRIPDEFANLEAYCEGVKEARAKLPQDIRLWVSVGHFSDLVRPFDWETDWKKQASELTRAGADALELHFNTPGVLIARDRVYDFYRLVYKATKMIRSVTSLPIMVKLPLENCDTLRAIDAAVYGGASAVGPTARWKAFQFDLDWKRTLAEAGGGYGGTQALPVICQIVAEARNNGITIPLYAGGGVFSWQAAAKLIMAGSDIVQIGSLGCCEGPQAVKILIKDLSDWMEKSGYSSIDTLKGAALSLFKLTPQQYENRTKKIGEIYRNAQVNQDKCIGCENCENACWYEGIEITNKKAAKTVQCIGCGYCFSVCPTGALSAPQAADAASAVLADL
jgi:dihydroorotate dehydrogenase/ferredoxin